MFFFFFAVTTRQTTFVHHWCFVDGGHCNSSTMDCCRSHAEENYKPQCGGKLSLRFPFFFVCLYVYLLSVFLFIQLNFICMPMACFKYLTPRMLSASYWFDVRKRSFAEQIN